MLTSILSLCSGTTGTSYVVITNDSAIFMVTTSLPNGAYTWKLKSSKTLANSGTLTIAGDNSERVEMGFMKAGDANNGNDVNVLDFNILKLTFGRSPGDPGYDARGDFNNDNIGNSLDFNLLKLNFGVGGAPLTCP